MALKPSYIIKLHQFHGHFHENWTKSFFVPENRCRRIWGICMEKLQKMFPKITRMYKYYFSKFSKWAHFQFGVSFYEYFDFSAISDRSNVKISWFFQFFVKFWPFNRSEIVEVCCNTALRSTSDIKTDIPSVPQSSHFWTFK